MSEEKKTTSTASQHEMPLGNSKQKKATDAGSKSKSAAAAASSSDGEPDFGGMDAKQLRALYAEMSLTLIDLGAKTTPLPEDAPLSELRQTCRNVHRFIQVRRTQTGKGASSKPSKAQRQQAAAKNTGPKSEGAKAGSTSKPSNKADEEKTMTTKTKKTAAKKTTAKKAAPKADTWAGYALTAKVTVVNKENPAREGTSKWKRWNALLTGGSRSIEALKKAKINSGTLRNAVKSRHVKVA